MRALNLAHAAAVTAGALMCGLDVVSTMFRNSSWVLSWRPTQMMRAFSGRSLATSRAYIAGSSLRIARSPLPPNRTRSKSVSAIVCVFAVRLRARGAPDYICKFTTRISQAQENLLHNGACQRVRGVFRLFLIRGLGLAGDGYPQLEHLAIMRVLRQFCRRAVVAGAGDVQRAQICAAEGQHGRTAHRQLHFLQHHALRRNAQHARALEQRAPVVAGAVDGGAVGTAAVIGRRLVGRELLEQLLVRHRAGGHIVGVARDAVGRGVRVVHGAPVGTEAEAVGIGHAARPRQAQRALFQHVHCGRLLVARLVDRADPEAAGRIGATVVEAHLARVVGRGDDVGDGAAARVQMDDGAPYDTSKVRFNDGRADPAGRFWVGTIYEPRDQQAAAMYVLEQGALRLAWSGGMTNSNGLGFSPDRRTMYHSDTAAHRVTRYAYDMATGAVSDQQLFQQFSTDKTAPDYGGRPDGATVDSAGNYWCALFEGARVLCISPQGVVLEEVRLPVRCPTMLAFGGADLRTLYITSASHNRPPAELAQYPHNGKVLKLRLAITGQPEPAYQE